MGVAGGAVGVVLAISSDMVYGFIMKRRHTSCCGNFTHKKYRLKRFTGSRLFISLEEGTILLYLWYVYGISTLCLLYLTLFVDTLFLLYFIRQLFKKCECPVAYRGSSLNRGATTARCIHNKYDCRYTSLCLKFLAPKSLVS